MLMFCKTCLRKGKLTKVDFKDTGTCSECGEKTSAITPEDAWDYAIEEIETYERVNFELMRLMNWNI